MEFGLYYACSTICHIGLWIEASTDSDMICKTLKAKFHYAIQLANQLTSWFASWSATC